MQARCAPPPAGAAGARRRAPAAAAAAAAPPAAAARPKQPAAVRPRTSDRRRSVAAAAGSPAMPADVRRALQRDAFAAVPTHYVAPRRRMEEARASCSRVLHPFCPTATTLPHPASAALSHPPPPPLSHHQAVRTYFGEICSERDVAALEELVTDTVEYRDPVCWGQEVFLGRRRLAAILRDYGRAYPNLSYRLEALVADEGAGTAFAHWSASGAHLSAAFMGTPATGVVSSMRGVTVFSFDMGRAAGGLLGDAPRISAITSYRTILAEERAAFAADVPDFD